MERILKMSLALFALVVVILPKNTSQEASTVNSTNTTSVATSSKYQIECTMCAACENPCGQVPSPPPPSPSPPPPATTSSCPPPPSPPPAQPSYTYSSPPPPSKGGSGPYYPAPSGGAFYTPPSGVSYPGPPPPNPIVPYFPFYYYNPPPAAVSSNTIKLRACDAIYAALIALLLV